MTMNFGPADFERYRLRRGDILLNEGQSLELVGRAAMFRDEIDGGCFQNTLVRFRAGPHVLPAYALTVFRAYFYAGRFRKIASWTTSIAHLGAERFAELEFLLPPLAEQGRIVAEVERRLSLATGAERSIEVSLRRAGALRQAILSRAFEGRLVAQDPADEPAAVLLDRIGRERDNAADTVRSIRKPRPINGPVRRRRSDDEPPDNIPVFRPSRRAAESPRVYQQSSFVEEGSI
jgi:type I restriction enzyme S subunit